ncbi:MAG: SOS response-associated peptidase [Pseudomonadota bacterium]
MCGRYLLTSPPDEVAATFAVDVRDNFPPRYNIAPTQPIGVIHINERRDKAFALMRWGFIPSWMDAEKGHPMNNARAETVAEKPSFRSAYKRRRCLVPADGFYEWTGEAGARQPYLAAPAAGGLFGFAGIWETCLAANGSEADTVAILTIAAGPDMAALHHREPVVIDPDHYDLWLQTDERDMDQLTPLLHARAEGYWRLTPVSTDVNNARNDGPDLIRPVEVTRFKTDLFE